MENFIKNWKVITAALTTLIALLIGAGYTFDRPAWSSEVEAIAQQVTINGEAIQQIQTDALQRSIWRQEDRLEKRSTSDGKQRLRELKKQMQRLKELKRRKERKK